MTHLENHCLDLDFNIYIFYIGFMIWKIDKTFLMGRSENEKQNY